MAGPGALHDTEAIEADSAFRAALGRADFAAARQQCEALAGSHEVERWVVSSMLEELGLELAHRRQFDHAIEAFERALELGWDVVPDGRCEIARVLLLAGRHDEARCPCGRGCATPIPTRCGR